MNHYFFTLILISLLMISGCDRTGQEAISLEDLKQISLLPQDAHVLGFTNYQKIHESPFFNSLVDTNFDKWLSDDDFAKFYQQTQLNFRKDIHKIFFAGKVYTGSHQFDGLLVAQGKFDAEKIMTYIENQAKAEQLVPEMYAGVKFYRPVSGHATKPFIFGFFDSEFFVGGVDSLVKNWVDLKKNGDSNQISDALVRRINHLKYKNSAWFILDSKAFLENLAPEYPGPEQMLHKIRHLDFSIDVAQKARFCGELDCTDAESAELFEDAIKGAISTMKLSATGDREVIDILNQIKVKTGQQQVQISFQISQQDLEKLKSRRNFLKLPTV